MNVKEFLKETGFDKYYYVVESNEELDKVWGEPESYEGSCVIGDEVDDGKIVAFALAKYFYVENLSEYNPLCILQLDDDTFAIGDIAGDRFYDITLEEIEDSLDC